MKIQSSTPKHRRFDRLRMVEGGKGQVALRRSKPRGLGRSYGGFECEKVEMCECKKVKNDRTLFGGQRFNPR